MAQGTPNLPEPIIHGTISADPAELRELADAIVRGASIVNAEIEDMRQLIDAVQAHPNVRLARIGEDGKPTIDDPTTLEVQDGVVQESECESLEIGLTLLLTTHFARNVSFSEAIFVGDAFFEESSFARHASFSGATFAQEVGFGGASFTGGASFSEANFAKGVWFAFARFAEEAAFFETIFAGRTSFARTSFSGEALFSDASFAEETSFSDSDFAGDMLIDARRIDLRTIRFGPSLILLNSDASEPKSRFEAVRSMALSRFCEVRDRLRHFGSITFGWPLPRSFGQLSILNRASLLALILVPVIAGAWPAVRAVVNGYNHAISESRLKLDEAAGKLGAVLDTDAAKLDSLGAGGAALVLQEQATHLQTQAAKLDEQFGSIAVERHHLPYTLALAFFAALVIFIAQFIYQVFAPDEIKKHAVDGYIDLMHKRYPEGAPDRNDGLRKACDALKTIAAKRQDRHENFVTHHGETVWIPPGTHIQWFTDPTKGEVAEEAERARAAVAERTAPAPTKTSGTGVPPVTSRPTSSGSASTALEPALAEGTERKEDESLSSDGRDARPTRLGSDPEELSEAEVMQPAPLPPGCIPGAERARIAIEEGARAEYWMIGRRNLGWAWACAILYAVGLLLLAAILILQGWNVGHAAEWW